MYRVAIKESAISHAAAVREYVDEHGTTPQFDSRREAEAFLVPLAEEDGGLRLQAPAASDPAAVDAYLVRDAQRNEWTPIESDAPGVTFPVGGNVYGALGVELVYLGGTASPALSRFVDDLGGATGAIRITNVAREPGLPNEITPAVGWRPDLRVDLARDHTSGPETYFAEVKSGDASFERSQRRDMQRVAEDYGVLKVRVDLGRLPEQYTVRIDEVAPDEWPS